MGTGFCNFNRLGWDTQTPISPPLHSIKVEREDEGVISNRPEPGIWVSTLAGGINPCYWGIIYRIRTRFPVDVKQTTGTEDVSIFSLSTRRNMGSTDYDKTILYRLISKYLISDTVLSLSTVTRRNLDRITFWIYIFRRDHSVFPLYPFHTIWLTNDPTIGRETHKNSNIWGSSHLLNLPTLERTYHSECHSKFDHVVSLGCYSKEQSPCPFCNTIFSFSLGSYSKQQPPFCLL